MSFKEGAVDMRVERLVRERLEPAIHQYRHAVEVAAWHAPGDPVSFEYATRQRFEPFAVGTPWGQPWGTTWFRVTGVVPAEWWASPDDVELVVDLGFTGSLPGYQAEGMFWSAEGTILKGLEPTNQHLPMTDGPGRPFEVYVEAGANPDIIQGLRNTPTPLGRLSTAPPEPLYILRRAELVCRDRQVWELVQDIRVVWGLAHELPEHSARRAALYASLAAVADAIEPNCVGGSAAAARAILEPVLTVPAEACAHRAFAVGHAHIDSQFLWPARETMRKCARTFANVLQLMDQDPDFVFACSSAQHLAWMKQYYPELFERIRSRVAEGRFVPVGGMWVESDTNMPGSEAMVRQFTEGLRFFREELDAQPTEVWLPDSFGYTGSLPQIATQCGMRYALVQKIAWNDTSRFPHNTFLWEGIDGTRIFTHSPSVESYGAVLSAAELARAERNFANKWKANTSLVPFGHSDGGGGPTREMLAAAVRTKSLAGSPTVRIATPSEFFAAASAEIGDPDVWVGELYLQLHRGSYSSQAQAKRGNRACEALLHEAELWSATATVRTGARYPADELQAAWQTVLLHQFHDALSGTSIGWVNDQMKADHEHVASELESLIAESVRALSAGAKPGSESMLNSSPFPVLGVRAHGIGRPHPGFPTRLEETQSGYQLSNDELSVSVSLDGVITSIVQRSIGRELLPPHECAGVLQVFQDTPKQWDAWDIDVAYRATGVNITQCDDLAVVEDAANNPAIRIRRSFGSSRVEQTIGLAAVGAAIEIDTAVDWRERQKMLKLAFPVDIHTGSYQAEIQFGHIERPTHVNTDFDAAQFETCAHRWVQVEDRSVGVGVVNDAVYGHDVTRHVRHGGGTYTLIRQTLLRSPLYPDPQADHGHHSFRTCVVAGQLRDTMEVGYHVRHARRVTDGPEVAPLISASGGSVLVETIKLADDGSGDVIIRLYESLGTHCSTTLLAEFDYAIVMRSDLCERRIEPAELKLTFRPYEIATLRFIR